MNRNTWGRWEMKGKGKANTFSLISPFLKVTENPPRSHKSPTKLFTHHFFYMFQLEQGTILTKLDYVATFGSKNAFHGTLGFDYFFSMRDGFPWEIIPPFVIGRPVFDNWLVSSVMLCLFMTLHACFAPKVF